MAVSQSMIAKSSALAADFGGGPWAPPSCLPHLGGEPVKIQASDLSNYLTSSGSALQKVQQVDISMEPFKIQGEAFLADQCQAAQKALKAAEEALKGPPGFWFPPETHAMAEPWVGSLPEYWQWAENSWWMEQVMPEFWVPPCISDMPPVSPHVPVCFLPSTAVEGGVDAKCGTVPTPESGLGESGAESTELSGHAESSASDDEWSSRASGSPSFDGAHAAGTAPQDTRSSELLLGSEDDGVKMGRLLLSLLNNDASDAPNPTLAPEWDANTRDVNDLLLMKIEERESKESGADEWNEQTFGAESKESWDSEGMPAPPPGLPLPLKFQSCASAAHDMVGPPPGLTTPQMSQSSGSDADVSDVEAPCSASTPDESCISWPVEHACPAIAEQPTTCATEECLSSSPPEMQMVSPSAQTLPQPAQGALPARRKGNKTTRQQRPKAPATALEVKQVPVSAHQKKAVVSVPAPEQPISPSRNKARVESRQPRTRTPPSSAKKAKEAPDTDTAILDEMIGFRLSTDSWWLVLLSLVLGVLAAVLINLVAQRGEPVQVDASLAYEVSASAMVVPGASYACTTAVPASASAHMWSQKVSSLAKSMDIEFARANAVASYLKSKVTAVRQAMKARRQEKERMRQFQQFQQGTGMR